MHDNLEKKFEKFLKEAKKNALLSEEKEEIKSQLLSFIKENPEVANGEPLPNRASFVNIRPAFSYIFLAVMLAVLGGIGISVVAQNALPGESLYPIKTGVNERVLALALFSDQAKAEYDINLAQLRLEEFETIDAQNKLTDKSSREVKTLLSDHLSDIKNRIINLKNRENARIAAELSAKLEVLLKEHAKTLDKLVEDKEVKN